jgi:nucleoside 2-deoxyribosyltransferase
VSLPTSPDVYVAGKTHDFQRVRMVQEMFKLHGFTISHDWTETVEAHGDDVSAPEMFEQCARNDCGGVYTASLVVALGHPRICGTVFELGFATALNLPCWLVDWEAAPRSVFWELPNMRRIAFADLSVEIEKISPRLAQTRLTATAIKLPNPEDTTP